MAERQEVGYIGTSVIHKVTKTLVVPIPRLCNYFNEEEVRNSIISLMVIAIVYLFLVI